MEYNSLGKTGLKVSRLSFGASALGGVYGKVDEAEGIRAVHTALGLGINYFNVAPAYGGTVAVSVLGKALKGIARDCYYLSTKVGKYTQPGGYGDDTLDYSRARTRHVSHLWASIPAGTSPGRTTYRVRSPEPREVKVRVNGEVKTLRAERL